MIHVTCERVDTPMTTESTITIPVSNEVAAKRLLKKTALVLAGTTVAMVAVIKLSNKLENETPEED